MNKKVEQITVMEKKKRNQVNFLFLELKRILECDQTKSTKLHISNNSQISHYPLYFYSNNFLIY